MLPLSLSNTHLFRSLCFQLHWSILWHDSYNLKIIYTCASPIKDVCKTTCNVPTETKNASLWTFAPLLSAFEPASSPHLCGLLLRMIPDVSKLLSPSVTGYLYTSHPM